MVDKITTISRSKLGERIGQLSDDDMISCRAPSWYSSDSQRPDSPHTSRTQNH